MEKRAIFDNPFGYEPVSPYRIHYQRSQVGEIQIMNLPSVFGVSIEEMKNAADNISNAVQRMGESINTFAQQSTSFHNDIDSLRSDLSVNGSRDVDLSSEVEQEMNVLPKRVPRKIIPPMRIPSMKESPPPLDDKLDVAPLINKLNEVITVMKSFDIQANLGNIYKAIALVAQRINFLQDAQKGYPMMLNLLKDVDAKLENANDGIRLLSNRYAELAKAYDEINKRLVESFNTFTPLIQNVSSELQTTNQNLIALGNAVAEEGKATGNIYCMTRTLWVSNLKTGRLKQPS